MHSTSLGKTLALYIEHSYASLPKSAPPSLVTLSRKPLPFHLSAVTVATETILPPAQGACPFGSAWYVGVVVVLVLDLHLMIHDVYWD